MADIELVVKIPEEAYELLKNKGVDWLGAEHILNAVANGTPLPKGSESMNDFDARKLVEKYYEPVEDKPGYVWLNKRNMQMISIDALTECLENGRRRRIQQHLKPQPIMEDKA